MSVVNTSGKEKILHFATAREELEEGKKSKGEGQVLDDLTFCGTEKNKTGIDSME